MDTVPRGDMIQYPEWYRYGIERWKSNWSKYIIQFFQDVTQIFIHNR